VTAVRPWCQSVGFLPHKVTVYEHADKSGVLYLRWRAGGNWRKRSLGMGLRDVRGRIRPEIRDRALAEAQTQYEILSGKRAANRGPTTPLTLGETWAIVSGRDGLYPVLTPHAKEVARALTAAARILGSQLPWDVVDRASIRLLGRARIDELRAHGHAGYRSAEVVVQRVLGVAAWLRDEGRIANDACLAPRRWREDLRGHWEQVTGSAMPRPAQPRHTLDEMRTLLAAAPAVDPRFDLLLALGAELRLGQVARARRSDLDELHRTLTIRGRRNKKGAVVDLTEGQWSAWLMAKTGYLAALDRELMDYPLFPRGQMPGGRSGKAVATVKRHGLAAPIGRTAIRKWFAKAETAAGIEHVEGRSTYGLRRVLLDAAKERHISREGLKAWGGWSDTQVPDLVYADQDAAYARAEAAEIRAKVRGES
jgi:integrase